MEVIYLYLLKRAPNPEGTPKTRVQGFLIAARSRIRARELAFGAELKLCKTDEEKVAAREAWMRKENSELISFGREQYRIRRTEGVILSDTGDG